MVISEQAKRALADMIVENIRKEFANVHLSFNLVNTIVIEEHDGDIRIRIPAQIYDVLLYKRKGVLSYTGSGSYANEVDISGGFSGKHKHYVDNCINNAIKQWMAFYRIEGTVS